MPQDPKLLQIIVEQVRDLALHYAECSGKFCDDCDRFRIVEKLLLQPFECVVPKWAKPRIHKRSAKV